MRSCTAAFIALWSTSCVFSLGDLDTDLLDAGAPRAPQRQSEGSHDPGVDIDQVVDEADAAVDRDHDAGVDPGSDSAIATGVDAAAAPDTILISGPQGTTPLTSARFSVGSDVEPVDFVCSLDGALTPCAAEFELEDLAPGTHQVMIAARDSEGVLDPLPLQVTWTIVDEVAPQLAQVAVGYNHACAITRDGALYCAGHNSSGQLGVGDLQARTLLRRVGEASHYVDVAAGRLHSCAIREGGELYCWGNDGVGQLGVAPAVSGRGNLLEPTQVIVADVAFSRVSAGQFHTCAVGDEGELYCWGYNLFGRLGDGSGTGGSGDPGVARQPTRIDPAHEYLDVSAGASHSCALRSDNSIVCFGANDRGQLGATAFDSCQTDDSSSPLSCALSPVPVEGESATVFTAVSVGSSHSCALTEEGLGLCWGDNAHGQLGVGTTAAQSTPAAVASAEHANSYSALGSGGTHSCAVTATQTLECWGDASNGQLGFPGMQAFEPSPTGPSTPIVSVAAGDLASCAVASSGALFCWGTSALAAGLSPEYKNP